MPRKHSVAIADTLGLQLRFAPDASTRVAILETSNALCRDFKAANNNFKADRFMDHVIDFAEGTKAVTS